MAARKRATKAKTKAKNAQPTYTARILTPFWDATHFEGGSESGDWLLHRRPGIASALLMGFDSEDDLTRTACYVLMQDLEELTCAAAEALATGQRVDVGVQFRPGSDHIDYPDALRDLAHAVRVEDAMRLRNGDTGGEATQGFRDLVDLLVGHMDALADGRSHREEAAA